MEGGSSRQKKSRTLGLATSSLCCMMALIRSCSPSILSSRKLGLKLSPNHFFFGSCKLISGCSVLSWNRKPKVQFEFGCFQHFLTPDSVLVACSCELWTIIQAELCERVISVWLRNCPHYPVEVCTHNGIIQDKMFFYYHGWRVAVHFLIARLSL